MHEQELVELFRQLWRQSSELNWDLARLGRPNGVGGYDVEVPGKPGYVYISKGANGELGQTLAVDRIGVDPDFPWQLIKMRQEYKKLVIREAEHLMVGTGGGPAQEVELHVLNDPLVHSGPLSLAQGPWWLPLTGGTITGNVLVSPDITIDTVDISAFFDAFDTHVDEIDAHHPRVTAGNGLVGSGTLLQTLSIDLLDTDPNYSGLKFVDGDLSLSLKSSSALEIDSTGLSVAGTIAGQGLDWDNTNKIASAKVSEGIKFGGLASDFAIVDEDYDFTWTGLHIFDSGSTFNAGTFRFNQPPQVNANIDFIGATTRTITAASHLTIAPTGQLNLTPTGVLYLNPGPDPNSLIQMPNAQTFRSDTTIDAVTGIMGMDFSNRPDFNPDYVQLTIGAIKADELFVRIFTADEVRVSRGEQIWSRSFGIVETNFDQPADEATADVWFEDVPALEGANLFLAETGAGLYDGSWLQCRTIDMEVGLTVQTIWWRVGAKLADAAPTDGPPPRVARQQWRIKRVAGGSPNIDFIIKKGNVFVDFGLVGHGVVHLSALTELAGSKGPFIQVGVFDSVATTPVHKYRARFGNLNGVAGYATNVYGIAAANDLSQNPLLVGSTFSGFTLEETNGLRLYNAEIKLFDGSTLVAQIMPSTGFNLLIDDLEVGHGDREISWYDDLDPFGNRYARIRLYTNGNNNELRLEAESSDVVDPTTFAAIRLSADHNPGGSVTLLMSAEDNLFRVLADTTAIGNRMVVGGLHTIDPVALLHTYENNGAVNQTAGVMIQQSTSLGVGDAVLHWFLSAPTVYFSAGIDNSDGDKWKLSRSHSLGTSDLITVDSTTVTIPIASITDLTVEDADIETLTVNNFDITGPLSLGSILGIGVAAASVGQNVPGISGVTPSFDYDIDDYSIIEVAGVSFGDRARVIIKSSGDSALDIVSTNNGDPDTRWLQITKHEDNPLSYIRAMNFDGTERFQMLSFNHSTGRVSVGGTAPILAQLDVVSADGGNRIVDATRYSSTPAFSLMGRRATGSEGAPGPVDSGDVILDIAGLGYTSGGWADNATGDLILLARENFDNGDDGSVAGEWQFYAKGIGELINRRRLTIGPEGVTIGEGGTGSSGASGVDSPVIFRVGTGEAMIMGIDFVDGDPSGNPKWKLSRGDTFHPYSTPSMHANAVLDYDITTGVLLFDATVAGTGGETFHHPATSGDGIDVGAEQEISVDDTVVRTGRQIIAGAGLQGGGALDTDVTLDILAVSTGGIQVNANSIQILFPENSGLDTDATGLHFAAGVDGDGLSFLSGVLNVDSTVARSNRTIGAGNGLTGGGTLATDLEFNVVPHATGGLEVAPDSISIKLPTNSGLMKDTTGVYIPAAFGGDGLTLTAGVLDVDSSVVRTTRQVIAGAGMTGGGLLSADVTLNVIATDASLTVSPDSMAVNLGHTWVWGGTHTFSSASVFNSTVTFGNTSSLIFKDTDVAHGMTTTMLATENYAMLEPLSGTAGGLRAVGAADIDATGVLVQGINGAASPAVAAIILRGEKKSGVSTQALAAGEPVLGINNATTRLMTVMADGQFGFGTATPGIDVVGTFDYAGVGLIQVDGTHPRVLVRGSATSAFDLIDTGGTANAKWVQIRLADDIFKFITIDDTGTLELDNILTLDPITGASSFGFATTLNSTLSVSGIATFNGNVIASVVRQANETGSLSLMAGTSATQGPYIVLIGKDNGGASDGTIQYLATTESSAEGYHEWYSYDGSSSTKTMELRPTTFQVLVAADFDSTVNVDGVATFGATPQVNANLNFAGSARTITSAAGLTLGPTGDLTLDPSGIIILPNAQEMKTFTFTDAATGIDGFRMWDRGSNYRQLTTGAVKVDELYARVFVADGVRIDLGEELWGKSYGIVEEDFTLPADEALVFVWFEDVPGFDTAPIFEVDDWLEFRYIDWDVSLAIVRVFFQVLDGDVGGSNNWVQHDATNYRQQWWLRRKSGGTTNQVIKKGAVAVDLGQSGQGIIHLSVLEQAEGPFIQFGKFVSVAASPNERPVFDYYTKIGNLNGTIDYVVDTYGIIAGNNIGNTLPNFSGFTADGTNGLRLFNTEFVLYESGVKIGSFGEDTGIVYAYDDDAYVSPSRGMYWTSGSLPTLTNHTALSAWRDVNGNQVRLTTSNAGEVSIIISATNTVSGRDARLNMDDDQIFLGIGDSIKIEANGRVEIGHQNIGGAANVASRLHVWEETSANDATTGVTIENDHGSGDAVLQFFAGQRWTMGIDRSDSNKFKMTAGTGLASTSLLDIHPSTGLVTVSLLKATGAVDFDSTLNVDGTSNFEGAMTVDDILTVTGVTSLQSNLLMVSGSILVAETIRAVDADLITLQDSGGSPKLAIAANGINILDTATSLPGITFTVGAGRRAQLISTATDQLSFYNFNATTEYARFAGSIFSVATVRAMTSAGLTFADDAGVLGMFIQDATGWVGVGTSTPGANLVGTYDYTTEDLLQVDGALARVIIRGSTNAALGLIDTGGGANSKWMELITSTGIAQFRSIDDAGAVLNSAILAMDHFTGKVGIGVTPTLAALAVKAGSSSNDVAVGGVLYVNTTVAGNVGTGDDTLMSYSVPANTLAINNQSLWFEATGKAANNANTKTVRIKYGSTTILSFSPAPSSENYWHVRGRGYRTGAATQKWDVELVLRLVGSSSSVSMNLTTSAETLSGAVTFSVTGETSAASNNDVTCESLVVGWDDANA